ncbi:NAD-P-binding protein [Flammula alnicola]|nr:NAD-P-binding protein [Flammula alnicola]
MELLVFWQWIGLVSVPFIALGLYVYRNDRALTAIPQNVLPFSPKRCSPKDVRETAKKIANSPPKEEVLPPKTGRRYIVVGGGGFLGGWIVTKLLERGEAFDHIRLLDLRPPINYVVKDALLKGVQFIPVDITDADALEAAFKAPWPASSTSDKQAEPEITVFHTVAVIRFYERHPEFMERSARVNVTGTKNVINASRAAGATALIFTSSGSVAVHTTGLFLWPWQKEPEKFLQIINDDDSRLPKRREDFFSNYAVTKIQAERIVQASDRATTGTELGAKKVMRTGCIRPGNAIFGPRGDLVTDVYLAHGSNPTWTSTMIQSFSYVENCAAAHLCYEARLIDLLNGSTNPDIGGQAFCITDPGPPPTFGDFYTVLETRTDGKCNFPKVSPTAMLFLAHLLELYSRVYHALLSAGWNVARLLPLLRGDIINLQPPLFSLTSIHVIVDDSRARLLPEKGGLGYSGTWTTLEGAHKVIDEYNSRPPQMKAT